MNSEPSSAYDYQVGGCLPQDCQTYVKRQADLDFYQGMMAGEFCYVLNSRQMGKSSLRVQTMQRLRSEGVACAVVDLTSIGCRDITPQQWYASIIKTLADGFHLSDKIDIVSWWCDREIFSPVQRLDEFIGKVLLKEIPQKLAIFVDEIDSVKRLNFPVDDFFALIKSCYNKRADRPEYRRLAFALLGVATPSELIQDANRTPFDIGIAIDLTGFQLHESLPLAKGLARKTKNPLAVLKAILDWTGGKPFLVQKLCKLAIGENSQIREGREAEWVEELVRSRIVENWESQDEPEHLRTIRERLLHRNASTVKLLKLYQQILHLGEIPADDTPEKMELRLSGLVVKHQGKLKVYNRIYQLIFNQSWVHQELEKLQDPENQPMREKTNSDEQLLYDHLLELSKRKSPTELLERFNKLFIDGMGYPESEVEAALYRIIAFLNLESKFNYFLNRCCYILINRWQANPKYKDAIADLVALLEHGAWRYKQKASPSRVVRRLHELVYFFTQSDEYHILKRLLPVVEINYNLHYPEPNQPLSQLIYRYPYLYSHYLLPEDSSYEHRQMIRQIQEKNRQQFENKLSEYIPYLFKRVQQAPKTNLPKTRSNTFGDIILNPSYQPEIVISQSANMKQTVPNPTLLTDEELYFAIKEFVGKAEQTYTYKDLANIFLSRHTITRTYRDFKEDLYQYLIASVDAKYGKHHFNQRLYNFLKNTLTENDNKKIDELLIMRTCSQLFNFLVTSPQDPEYLYFFDMLNNLGTLKTVGLLLKIALLSGKVKPHLEKRFSILFSYYETQTFKEIQWLVHSLENLNIALLTNFGTVDIDSIQKNIF